MNGKRGRKKSVPDKRPVYERENREWNIYDYFVFGVFPPQTPKPKPNFER